MEVSYLTRGGKSLLSHFIMSCKMQYYFVVYVTSEMGLGLTSGSQSLVQVSFLRIPPARHSSLSVYLFS